MTLENVKSKVVQLLESNIQDNIYLAINILAEYPTLTEELKEVYFIRKYITMNMPKTEFEMWAKIVFKPVLSKEAAE